MPVLNDGAMVVEGMTGLLDSHFAERALEQRERIVANQIQTVYLESVKF